ncbi:MAG: hypothetical protein HYS04_12845 [Acidobacteria bacterium]|nr:hypothetical protein [Acidobacteriota bacterium]
MIFALFGFLGLALDASYLYFHKRNMQTAADAGAFAGALEKMRASSSTAIVAAAKQDTSRNGFTDTVAGVSVSVNNPPTSGAKAGNSDFIEVIVTHDQPTWFMRMLNWNAATVRARAVAGIGDSKGCIFALNRDSSNVNNGFFVNGTTDSTIGCGIFSNANFRAVGGGCVITPSASFTGSYTNQNTDGPCGPTGISEGVPVVDPIASLYSMPSYSTCDYNNYQVTTGSTVTLLPGTYCGGIDIGGTTDNVIFAPGSYVLAGGGMRITSSTTVTGAGVTFFNTYPDTQMNRYDGISINGTGKVTFTAPTAGTYKGLLFYQDPRVTWTANNGTILAGGSDSVYQGIIYFPSTDLQFSGNSSVTVDGSDGYTLLIGYNIKIAGTAHINMDFSAIGGSPLQQAVFAE